MWNGGSGIFLTAAAVLRFDDPAFVAACTDTASTAPPFGDLRLGKCLSSVPGPKASRYAGVGAAEGANRTDAARAVTTTALWLPPPRGFALNALPLALAARRPPPSELANGSHAPTSRPGTAHFVRRPAAFAWLASIAAAAADNSISRGNNHSASVSVPPTLLGPTWRALRDAFAAADAAASPHDGVGGDAPVRDASMFQSVARRAVGQALHTGGAHRASGSGSDDGDDDDQAAVLAAYPVGDAVLGLPSGDAGRVPAPRAAFDESSVAQAWLPILESTGKQRLPVQLAVEDCPGGHPSLAAALRGVRRVADAAATRREQAVVEGSGGVSSAQRRASRPPPTVEELSSVAQAVVSCSALCYGFRSANFGPRCETVTVALSAAASAACGTLTGVNAGASGSVPVPRASAVHLRCEGFNAPLAVAWRRQDLTFAATENVTTASLFLREGPPPELQRTTEADDGGRGGGTRLWSPMRVPTLRVAVVSGGSPRWGAAAPSQRCVPGLVRAAAECHAGSLTADASVSALPDWTALLVEDLASTPNASSADGQQASSSPPLVQPSSCRGLADSRAGHTATPHAALSRESAHWARWRSLLTRPFFADRNEEPLCVCTAAPAPSANDQAATGDALWRRGAHTLAALCNHRALDVASGGVDASAAVKWVHWAL